MGPEAQQRGSAFWKEKERFLKAAREKKTDSIQGTPLWLAVDFPSKTFKVRRQRGNIFKVLKEVKIFKMMIKNFISRKTVQNEGKIKILKYK